MIPKYRTSNATVSSQDMFILGDRQPAKSELYSGNVENAVSDNYWVDNLYEESSDHLQSYLNKIAKIRVLKKEEEVKLAELIKQGDEKALEKMILHNLKLVVWAAMKYRGRLYRSHGMELMDLIQEGNCGLIMKAVKRFDPSFGFKFSTYALWWIKQMIGRSLDEKSRTIDLPVHLSEALRAYDKAVQKLTVLLLREPTLEEIAFEANFSVEKIIIIQDCIRQVFPIRIQTHYHDDGNANPLPYFQIASPDKTPEKLFHDKELKHSLTKILKMNLTIKEYEIFIMRYGLDNTETLTLEMIGRKYRVTRERIRQIEAKAFDKLKSNLQMMKLARGCGIKVDRDLYEAAKEKVISKLTFSSNDLQDIEKPETPIMALIKVVSEFYQVSEVLVRTGNREAKFVKPRHIAMYLLRKDLNVSFPQIAKVFNDMDHTSVMHGCQKIHDALNKTLSLTSEVSKIRKILQPENQAKYPLAAAFVSPLDLIKKVADFYRIDESLVYNGTEVVEVVKVRRIAAFLFREMLKLPEEDIGRKLGGKSHDTVVHWCDEIKHCIQSDDKIATEIENIKVSLYRV